LSPRLLRTLTLLASIAALAPGCRARSAPVDARSELDAGPVASPTLIQDLSRREDLAESLEGFLDGQVCGRYKRGARRLPTDVAAPEVGLDLSKLVSASSCSLKPLRLEPRDGGADAHLAWEVEGMAVDGARAVERGEGDAAFSGPPWRWARLETTSHARIERPARRFTEIAEASGLTLPDLPDEGRALEDFYRAGIAVRDFDRDGRLDVVAVAPNQVWRFRQRNRLRFEREPLGPPPVPGTSYSAVVAGDFDGDGDPDLILLASGPAGAAASRVLRNDQGHFTDVGLLTGGGMWHAGIATDLDGDGKLDLVVIPYPYSYRTSQPDDLLEATSGEPPRFFLGDGQLGFHELPLPAELRRGRWGLAAVAGDITGQGRREVYVANDYGSNDLWWLDEKGFHEAAAEHGLLDPGDGMSADLGDVNGDGRLDVYVGNMFSKAGTRVVNAAEVDAAHKARLEKFARGNSLLLAEADGRFTDQAEALGVNRGLWAFGSIFLDFDDDGRLDIAVADGFLSRADRKDL
jgi:hypothetical protein